MIKILVGGDVCPVGDVQEAFVEGNTEEIFHDLLEIIRVADLSVVNLECPLVVEHTPTMKAGSILSAPVECIAGFERAGWDILNLANNHSFDHGMCGLQETIDTIRRAGLHAVGAGLNIVEAQAPIIREVNGQRVVIYAMAEQEYSVADDATPGANPLDLISFVNAIREHKQGGIFIALVHGGREFYPYPSPEMIRRCRFMVDMGADAVVCCHTHCPLPWEIYKSQPIVYGMGNLVFESAANEPDSWHEGYLAMLNVERNHTVSFEAIPYNQSQTGKGVRRMDQEAQGRFLYEIERKSGEIKDSPLMKRAWNEYCLRRKESYLMELLGYNRLMRIAYRLLGRRLHSKHAVLTALHLTQCETHQEILKAIFRNERSE